MAAYYMKNTAITLLAVALLVPNISFAQVSPEAENALLRQIISLLTQQVQLLQTQVAQLTAERNTIRTELDELKVTNDANTSYIEGQKQTVSQNQDRIAEIDELIEDIDEQLDSVYEQQTNLLEAAGCRRYGDGVRCNHPRTDFYSFHYNETRDKYAGLESEIIELNLKKEELEEERESISEYLKYNQ